MPVPARLALTAPALLQQVLLGQVLMGRALPLLTRQVPVMPAQASQTPMPQVQLRAPSIPPPALPQLPA